MIKFSLSPHIYAAHFENSIIILDSQNDKYLSVIDDAANYFSLILKNSFLYESDKYIPSQKQEINLDELNSWINHFIEKKFIIPVSENVPQKLIASQPIKSGGLIEYKWDHKPSWQPFSSAEKLDVFPAFLTLAKVHRRLKKSGIKGILDLIEKTYKKNPNLIQPTESEINKLAATVDAATILYPKKTYCLAWASTFVLLALKRNWACSLEIGIQTNPFYAHAWAKLGDKVINDDPIIDQVLSIILKEPEIKRV